MEKVARGLSAGRVQSVAVRLVVEREREIKAFVPEEFWEVDANVTTPGGDALPLQVSHHNDKPFRPENRDQTMAAVALLEKARYQVLDREDKPTSSKRRTVYHVNSPAGGKYASGLRREENHDDGPALV